MILNFILTQFLLHVFSPWKLYRNGKQTRLLSYVDNELTNSQALFLDWVNGALIDFCDPFVGYCFIADK